MRQRPGFHFPTFQLLKLLGIGGKERKRGRKGERKEGRERRKKKRKEGKKRNTGREEESQVSRRETETIDLCTPRAHSRAVKAPSANTRPGPGLQTPPPQGNQHSAGAGELARGGGRAGGEAGLVLGPIRARALPPVPEVALETPEELGWPLRGWAAREPSPTAGGRFQEGAGGLCRATWAQGGGWAFSGRGNQTLIGG